MHKIINTTTMKGKILLIVAAMGLTMLNATAQNRVDNQGRRQGHWIRTDKDGSKIFEGDFVDGLETGTFTYYYQDGSVRIKNTYTEPGRVCTHEAYDEQGHLLARGTFNQRNRDGRWQFYAEDGRLVKEATYKMGVKDGIHIIYTQKGDTAEVTHWSDNHRHGRWWKRIGKEGYITGTYVHGGLEGRLTEYDDNHQLIREGHYSGGLKHGSYRYFENNQLTVDETWNHGMLAERLVRILTPDEEFVSVNNIACMAPQGKGKVIVLMRDGTKKIDRESADDLYNRIGNDVFLCANRKSRVMVSHDCVQGMGKDGEGREILLLDPQPDFVIFPDEDGLKMVRSLQYEEHSPLDEMK